jgi:chromate transport protein ChrA
MKTVVALLMLCVVCAILKAVVVALVAALLLALLWSFITQPRETLVLLVTLALMGLANAHPIACIIGVTLVTIVLVLAGRTRKLTRAQQLPRFQ